MVPRICRSPASCQILGNGTGAKSKVSEQAPNIQPVSNSRAFWIGTLWINIPVLTIMFGGWGLPALVVSVFEHDIPPYVSPYLLFPLLGIWAVGPLVAAWMWWSINVPKWRIWALERVADWPALEQSAVGGGLIWDENTLLGRTCARTEIWSAADRERESELRRQKELPPRGA